MRSLKERQKGGKMEASSEDRVSAGRVSDGCVFKRGGDASFYFFCTR